jgi:hypothetical protein
VVKIAVKIRGVKIPYHGIEMNSRTGRSGLFLIMWKVVAKLKVRY